MEKHIAHYGIVYQNIFQKKEDSGNVNKCPQRALNSNKFRNLFLDKLELVSLLWNSKINATFSKSSIYSYLLCIFNRDWIFCDIPKCSISPGELFCKTGVSFLSLVNIGQAKAQGPRLLLRLQSANLVQTWHQHRDDRRGTVKELWLVCCGL